MPKLDLNHELWRLEGRTFHADGRRIIACNDSGCSRVGHGDDPGHAMVIAHLLETFFADRAQKAGAEAEAQAAQEVAKVNPALTPGEISFMRACQSAEPPSYCPTVLIGESLAEAGLAVYLYAENRPPWGEHYGHWVLTDAGRTALTPKETR